MKIKDLWTGIAQRKGVRLPAEFHLQLAILLVEDDPGDRDLIETHLAQAHGAFALFFAASLKEAFAFLNRKTVDVVLLDLGLPESRGVATLLEMRRQAPDLPIVVLTGFDDDKTGIEALKAGAQDYLVKGRTEPQVLMRSLRYALERHRLLLKLEEKQRKQASKREDMTLQSLSAPAGITAQLYGRKTLQAASSELFEQLSIEYGRLLLLALEGQVKKIDQNVSTALQDLAEQLGIVSAGPRDVVEIHKAALRRAVQTQIPAKARALAEEGRFRVLELMGHLVSFYRRHHINTSVLEKAEQL